MFIKWQASIDQSIIKHTKSACLHIIESKSITPWLFKVGFEFEKHSRVQAWIRGRRTFVSRSVWRQTSRVIRLAFSHCARCGKLGCFLIEIFYILRVNYHCCFIIVLIIICLSWLLMDHVTRAVTVADSALQMYWNSKDKIALLAVELRHL